MAGAFRFWAQYAQAVQEEANNFRIAVARWLQAVSYWERQLLLRCLDLWRRSITGFHRAASTIAANSRLFTLRAHFNVMWDAFADRRKENAKLLRAAAYFGAGLAKQTFDRWKTLLLQSKVRVRARLGQGPGPGLGLGLDDASAAVQGEAAYGLPCLALPAHL